MTETSHRLLSASRQIDAIRQRLSAARESALCNFTYEHDGCCPYAALPVDDVEEVLAVLDAVALWAIETAKP